MANMHNAWPWMPNFSTYAAFIICIHVFVTTHVIDVYVSLDMRMAFGWKADVAGWWFDSISYSIVRWMCWAFVLILCIVHDVQGRKGALNS